MKMSFYCLPLRKHVKAKVTAIVKKKSYSIKGVHKENGKDYNLNKVVGKAEAERISKETGIDIDEGQLAAAAEEFLPTGSGHVIGQNTAGMETAIEGTEETVTANTTPFRSEDDEDNIGPMRMEAETKKNCGCGQDPCVTYGSETRSSYEAEVDQAGEIVIETVEETSLDDTGYETFVVSQEHWDKVYQHSDWDDEITEMVHVYRNSDGIAIQVPNPFSDEVLEMIIATQDMPMDSVFKSEEPSTRSSLLGLGLGIIGFASAFALYQRYNKEE
jgi:hypothetical protein